MTSSASSRPVALITGASRGIGHAIALRLAPLHDLILVARDEQALSAVAVECEALGASVQCIVADVRNALVTAQRLTGLHVDVLVNNAGVAVMKPFLDMTAEEWHRQVDVNVNALYHVIRAVLPGMVAAGGGSIINMASVVSSIKGLPNRFIYGTTKAAVIGLTKSVAADYVGQGVRCNAICPGTVDTPSLADRINAYDDPAQARQAFIARQPLGRLATAQEIAPLVVFLASDESAFVTGQAYAIDGGISI